jgi:phosphoenolpyruvate carboxykinase (GTP)
MDSPHAKIGIELSDSAYVAVNMQIMTHMGDEVMKRLKPGRACTCLYFVFGA